jgi:predicted branched-subunit amino acid permease
LLSALFLVCGSSLPADKDIGDLLMPLLAVLLYSGSSEIVALTIVTSGNQPLRLAIPRT